MTTRMSREQLLAGRRVALLDAMHARPGRGFRELARTVGLSSGSASHHLAVLERHDAAWSIGHGPRRRFFPGARPSDDAAGVLARRAGLDVGMTLVLDFIRANPGCIQRDVKQAFTAKPRSTVQHILGRLERERFVHRSLSGRCVRYYPLAQGVERALACSFLVKPADVMAILNAGVSA